jgi:predicted PurR-regulated permease PerM
VVLLAFVLFETRVAIASVLAASLIATAMHHAVDALERHRVRHSLAVAAVLFTIIAVMTGIFLLIVPPAVSQGEALVAQAPQLIQTAKKSPIYVFLDQRFGLEQRSKQQSTETLQATAAPALRALSGVVGVVTAAITTFFLAIFMLLFAGPMIEALILEATLPRRQRYREVGRKIYHSVGGYISGIGMICTINAVMTTTFLAIARVPFFLPMGILSGFSSAIPYAGPITAGAVITLITLATHGVWTAVASIIYFTLYGLLEGQVLSPMIFRKTVHVNPLMTVLAILFLAELAGVVGAIVAVPMAAAGQIVIRQLLAERRERLHI